MNKRKGIILTLALIVVAGAAVVGSRMWKNSKHNEVNTDTENASEQIAQETDSEDEISQDTQGDVAGKSDTPTPQFGLKRQEPQQSAFCC